MTAPTKKIKISIHDHKFSSAKRYIPEEESARADYQTVVYAQVIFQFFPVDTIEFSYDYYGTKWKWAEYVQFSLTRTEIELKWEGVVRDTRGVLDNYGVVNAAQTIPNYLSCAAYGGCDMPRSVSEKNEQHTGQATPPLKHI